MTPTEFIEWLDQQITYSNRHMEEQNYDREAVEYCKGCMDTYEIVKEKFLTLTPPPTTLS